MMRQVVAFFGLVLCGACAQFPSIDQTVTLAGQAAPFPQIVNIDPLLAEAANTTVTPDTTAAIEARAAAARARGAALNRPVVSDRDRARMDQAVADRP
ncbi:hypothetical protein [Actibacterium sp. 188UL27-1]|uniref:hypothetical protein n=1 Tax=Actibacterium sp. 188UL27-1 TaxID=2786961 RepID=UPI00195E4965|nr:hypothetical protein [Actibacterium sp. 188UL27-1]MBM7069321.1 hypothetical protein [Actibacterium sp. 188UL27-1]